MALPIPTTKEVFDSNISRIESKTGQTTPALDKAYNRVISQNLAGNAITLYKFGVHAAKQCLALTADEGLPELAAEYGITPTPATKTVLTFTLPATVGGGTNIDTADYFVGDANGVLYYPDALVTESAGVITISATANTAGVVGNLQIGDTLTIGHLKSGAESQATVTSVDTTGAEAETTEALRIRVLDVIRAPGGGGDSADFRNWAQETPGVFRAYPYAGNPTFLETGVGSALPGERTVYIEADSTINIDGIAPGSLLTDAEDYITTDPDTGRARQPLPLGASTLYVESIKRTEFFVEITSLLVSLDLEATVKAEISTALGIYFRALRPFIDGLDFVGDQDNTITNPSIAKVIQDIVNASGGSFTAVGFNVGDSNLAGYVLGADELAKLASGGITYL